MTYFKKKTANRRRSSTETKWLSAAACFTLLLLSCCHAVKLSWQLHTAVAVCAPHLAAGWWTRLFSLFRFTLILVCSVKCKAKQSNNTEMLVFISFQLKNSFTAEWRRPYILSVNKCIQLETFSHWESHFTQMFFCTDCDLSQTNSKKGEFFLKN